ncbi:MAG TPA: hypothetical protein VJ851_10995 [Jatrophihabitans sp.]|nr:hypothetical protein [Jatrophihabitans sp.]
MSTTDAGTPVFDPSGYPHTDGDTTQLWTDDPAVPPPVGGGLVGLELVLLLAVLVGGGVLLVLVLLAALLVEAAVVEAALVDWVVLLVGFGLLELGCGLRYQLA